MLCYQVAMNTRKSPLPPLALIAGPTASGKSALALRWQATSWRHHQCRQRPGVSRPAHRFGAANAGRGSTGPHRLYGDRDGAEPCSAAEWAGEARAAIEEAHGQKRLPILVGGSGLYIRTLLEGIAPVPEIDPAIRSFVRRMSAAEAHNALTREDPQAAERLRPSDTTRLARALEVVRSTGRPLQDWQKERIGGIGDRVDLRPLILLPPRDWLYRRCDLRFEMMMSEHGQEEVRTLLARGLNPMLPIMRAIGVREIAAFLSKDHSREETLEAGKIATRRYAKRQYTWFAHQSPHAWPRRTDPIETFS
jgi:tRNA dimethylallyltransferase